METTLKVKEIVLDNRHLSLREIDLKVFPSRKLDLRQK